MYTVELIDYVRKVLLQNVSHEEINAKLLEKGWKQEDIDNAFSYIQQQDPNIQDSSSRFNPQGVGFIGVGSLIEAAINFVQGNMAAIYALLFMPIVIQLIVTYGISSSEFFGRDLYGIPTTNQFVCILFVLALLVFIQLWSQVALVEFVSNRAVRLGVIASYRRALSKMASYAWVSFLLGLITFGSIVFLFLPFVVLTIYFTAAVFVVIDDKAKGMDAILFSKKLIEGYWWAVFGRYVLLIGMAMTLVFGYMVLMIPITLIVGNNKVIGTALDVAFALVFIPFSAFSLVYMRLIYESLLKIKGGIKFTFSLGKKLLYVGMGMIGTIILLIIPIYMLVSFLSFFRSFD